MYFPTRTKPSFGDDPSSVRRVSSDEKPPKLLRLLPISSGSFSTALKKKAKIVSSLLKGEKMTITKSRFMVFKLLILPGCSELLGLSDLNDMLTKTEIYNSRKIL
jgi:hypothetical protein